MNKTVIAMVALGAAAFAAPAGAEKLKATLDGKAEVPATTSSGTGRHHRRAEPPIDARSSDRGKQRHDNCSLQHADPFIACRELMTDVHAAPATKNLARPGRIRE